MSGDPYWLDEERPALPERTLAGRPDVAVVGAGITGCSCALTAAHAGLAVRVYDARLVAEGASGRNGGFALRGGAAPYDVTAQSIGRDRARELWRLTEGALERLEELAGDAFIRTGSLRLANDQQERDELRGEFDAMRADGLDVEWRDEVDGEFASRFAGAIFHPTDAALQPARLVRRLAVRAAEAGVEFRERTAVTSVEELDADQVVIATDGYPSGLLGPLEGLIIPTRGQMIATEPLSERLFECPYYGRHGFDYWQQTPDGRLLAGGFRDVALQSEFTADEVTTPTIQQALDHFVTGLLGRAPRVTHRWAGLFGLVLDFLPVVGRVPGSDRLWVSAGYSGHGNVLGFLGGDLVARAILGEPHPLLETFEPARLL